MGPSPPHILAQSLHSSQVAKFAKLQNTLMFSLYIDDGLCLPGMERVKIPSNCRLLLKPGPLATLSPGLVGYCGLLHWSSETLAHDMLVDSWLDKAPTQHDLTGMRYIRVIISTALEHPPLQHLLPCQCSANHGSGEPGLPGESVL